MNKLLKITEHPVIATLITTAILTIIGAINLTTVFDTSIQWVKTTFNSLLNSILSVLNYEVEIWKIIVFFGVIVFVFALFIKWKIAQENNAESDAINEVTTTERENLILNLLRQNYEKRFGISDINRILRANDMMGIEQTVETLTFNKNLLTRYSSFNYGTRFALSREGRDYVLANGHIFS